MQVWDELDADEKRLAPRLMEVYAGFIDHADEQIGRLLEQIDALGKRDDTIVIAISDNGASPLGGPHGTYDHQRSGIGLRPSVEENLARLDDMGGPLTYNHYPFGWAMAGNTPFQALQGHTYGGGVRAPLLIRWPDGIRAKGETRRQFYHVVDITPTLVDLLGVPLPAQVNGVEQIPRPRAAQGVYGPHLQRPSCVIVGGTEDRGDGERMLRQPLHSKPAHQPVGCERSPSIKVRNPMARTTG